MKVWRRDRMDGATQLWLIHPNLFCVYWTTGLGWLRLFGFGLRWKDRRQHSLIFSERYGYQRGMEIGWLRLSYLRHWRHDGWGRGVR